MKKYEFTGKTKERYGITLQQIRRIADGEVGGWIENEENLSHRGYCWVYDSAQVSGSARVSGNAQVLGNTWVFGNAQIAGDARVSDSAQVSGSARVYDSAQISGNAQVFENARVYGDAQVFENARVLGNTWVFGNAQIAGSARVSGNAQVFENARVYGNAYVAGSAVATTTVLTCRATKDSITLTDNHCTIGCESHTHKHWLENTEAIGKEHGYTDIEIAEYKAIVFTLIQQMQRKLA